MEGYWNSSRTKKYDLIREGFLNIDIYGNSGMHDLKENRDWEVSLKKTAPTGQHNLYARICVTYG